MIAWVGRRLRFGESRAGPRTRAAAAREHLLLRRVRLRLTGWYVAVLLAILLVLGAAAFLAIRRSLAAETDRSLRLAAATQAERLEQEGPGSASSSSIEPIADADDADAPDAGEIFVYRTDAGGRVVANARAIRASGLPNQQGLAAALSGHTDLRTAGSVIGEVRLLSVPLAQGGALQVGRSLHASEDELHEIELALGLVALAGLALAAGGGFLLAGRALRPVREGLARQRAFVVDASHELRAPLTLIRATAETLAGEAERRGDAELDLFADLLDEVDRLGLLVADLLTLTQLDEARLPVADEIVDLGSVVRRGAQRIGPLLDGRQLSLQCPGEGALLVRGDEDRLDQILFILLDNAVKHTPAGTAISVRAWESRGRAVLVVTDTGLGLAPELLARAFDRVSRGESAHGHEGGAGLGLAIARGLAETMGGRLTLSRPTASGLRATLRLPAFTAGEG